MQAKQIFTAHFDQEKQDFANNLFAIPNHVDVDQDQLNEARKVITGFFEKTVSDAFELGMRLQTEVSEPMIDQAKQIIATHNAQSQTGETVDETSDETSDDGVAEGS